MKVFAVYWFAVAMTLATTTARPQENTEQQQQVNVEEVLQQAQNNAAGGFFPFISGNEEGSYNYNPGNGYQGPEFGGQQAETGQFFGPDAQTSVDGSHLSPEESLGELSSYLSPTHGEMSVFPVDSLKEEIPKESHVPPQDNKSPNSDLSLPSSPFAVDEVPNFSAFGQFGGNGATQSQNLIQGLWGMLNNAQNGNATAGGAGSGAVQNGTATGQGTGIANVGFGGFGIGLGIGGAIQTPLGNLAFGQGSGVAVGR